MTEHDGHAAAYERLHGFARTVAQASLGFRALTQTVAERFLPLVRQAGATVAGFMPALAEAAQAVQAAQAELNRTLRNARALGAMGWTLPYNGSIQDLHHLVDAATDAKSADAAFEAYYAEDCGAARRELLHDLLSRPDLADWRPLVEEVAVNLEAERHRVSVPALLVIFEGVAHRWTPDFWTRKTRDGRRGRDPYFRTKLSGLAADSFEFFEWSAMEAFVSALYSQAGGQKPLMLNRHWILHGRGLPEANLTDSLRLLQAIHTALELAGSP